MATFKVEVVLIDRVSPHPNADRLELISIAGMDFTAVSGKGYIEEGKLACYFPIDSLLPDPLIEYIDMVGKLAGAKKNRVKTVTLRGSISQGLVISLQEIASYLYEIGIIEADYQFTKGDDLSGLLGVIKHDPEPTMSGDAILYPLPDHIPYYDIEGADRYTTVGQYLIDNRIKVRIAEKVEGSNNPIEITDGVLTGVCSHGKWIVEKPDKEHFMWRIARQYFDSHLKKLYEDLVAGRMLFPGPVVFYGEIYGPNIQKNVYKLQRLAYALFDIRTNGRFLSHRLIDPLLSPECSVPVIAEDVYLDEWLDGKTIKEASNGPSLINNAPYREGIVITPMEEMRHEEIGRLIIKQRSPIYLNKFDIEG
jgi:RNA ligase (TIGR02306 family)